MRFTEGAHPHELGHSIPRELSEVPSRKAAPADLEEVTKLRKGRIRAPVPHPAGSGRWKPPVGSPVPPRDAPASRPAPMTQPLPDASPRAPFLGPRRVQRSRCRRSAPDGALSLPRRAPPAPSRVTTGGQASACGRPSSRTQPTPAATPQTALPPAVRGPSGTAPPEAGSQLSARLADGRLGLEARSGEHENF